jgi:DNA polymerase-3 subunit epsilon
LHNFQGEELQEEISVHNQALTQALETMISKQPSYLVIGRGRKDNEKSFVWVQRGNLKGYAFVDREQRIEHEEELDWIIQPLPSSEITPYLLKSHFESPKQCYIKTFSDPLLECDKL